jgi:hypothetical protein
MEQESIEGFLKVELGKLGYVEDYLRKIDQKNYFWFRRNLGSLIVCCRSQRNGKELCAEVLFDETTNARYTQFGDPVLSSMIENLMTQYVVKYDLPVAGPVPSKKS